MLPRKTRHVKTYECQQVKFLDHSEETRFNHRILSINVTIEIQLYQPKRLMLHQFEDV